MDDLNNIPGRTCPDCGCILTLYNEMVVCELCYEETVNTDAEFIDNGIELTIKILEN